MPPTKLIRSASSSSLRMMANTTPSNNGFALPYSSSPRSILIVRCGGVVYDVQMGEEVEVVGLRDVVGGAMGRDVGKILV